MANRPNCTYCDRPAVYIATFEDDPYVLACDQCCCVEGDLEDGHSVRIDDARGLLSLAMRSFDAVAQAVAAEREAIRAEVERQQRGNVGAGWERGFNFADLLAWLDARSKGGAK